MYKKILLPLDGSKLAECALFHMQNLFQDGFPGEAILTTVIWADFPLARGTYPVVSVNIDSDPYSKKSYSNTPEPSIRFDIDVLRERVRESLLANAQNYLADVQARFGKDSLKVKTEILENRLPAAAISDYARENGIDLIIIATHGYTGFKKLMFSSVALEILHNSHVPVLLIRPESCRS